MLNNYNYKYNDYPEEDLDCDDNPPPCPNCSPFHNSNHIGGASCATCGADHNVDRHTYVTPCAACGANHNVDRHNFVAPCAQCIALHPGGGGHTIHVCPPACTDPAAHIPGAAPPGHVCPDTCPDRAAHGPRRFTRDEAQDPGNFDEIVKSIYNYIISDLSLGLAAPAPAPTTAGPTDTKKKYVRFQTDR